MFKIIGYQFFRLKRRRMHSRFHGRFARAVVKELVKKIVFSESGIFKKVGKFRKHIFDIGNFEYLRYHTHDDAAAEVLDIKSGLFQFLRVFGHDKVLRRSEIDNEWAEKVLRTDRTFFQFFKIYTLMKRMLINEKHIVALFNNNKRIENFSDNAEFNRFGNECCLRFTSLFSRNGLRNILLVRNFSFFR